MRRENKRRNAQFQVDAMPHERTKGSYLQAGRARKQATAGGGVIYTSFSRFPQTGDATCLSNRNGDSDKERKSLFFISKKVSSGSCPLMPNNGANSSGDRMVPSTIQIDLHFSLREQHVHTHHDDSSRAVTRKRNITFPSRCTKAKHKENFLSLLSCLNIQSRDLAHVLLDANHCLPCFETA